jgi:DNA ligase-1
MKEAEGTKGKLADTIDVVIMGYYFGRGKRAEFGIGAILVGILDEKQEKVVTLAKIGTGLSDEVLRQTKQQCDELATPTMPSHYVVSKLLIPDVWCLPGLVVEVAADEITRSPQHSAGVALRFPRLVKFREDKTWQQATTLKEVRQLSNLSIS